LLVFCRLEGVLEREFQASTVRSEEYDGYRH
jgi:hypothetical protein